MKTTQTHGIELNILALTRALRVLCSPVRLELVTIDPVKLAGIEKRTAKLNKRAAKLGLAPVELQTGDRWNVVQEYDDHTNGGKIRTVYSVLDLYVAGNAPRVNGWQVCARLEHGPAGNVVQAFSAMPEHYRTAPCDCDHCGVQRARQITYVIRNAETGEHKQIGSTCVADFCRTDAGLVGYLEGMRNLFDGCDPGAGGGQPAELARELAEYAIAATRTGVYVSSKNETERSTLDAVRFAQNRCPNHPGLAQEWRDAQPTAADRHAAGYLLAFWAVQEQDGDYAHNLRTIARQGYVLPKQVALWISAVAGYYKACRKAVEARKPTRPVANRWLAAPGEKIRIQVEIDFTRAFEGEWGWSYLVVGFTPTGERVSWYQTHNPEPEGQAYYPEAVRRPGQVVWVLGTVKGLGEFRGTKETKLQRVTDGTKAPKWLDGIRVYATRKAMQAAQANAAAA